MVEDLSLSVDSIENTPRRIREFGEKGPTEYLRYVTSNESAQLSYKHFLK